MLNFRAKTAVAIFALLSAHAMAQSQTPAPGTVDFTTSFMGLDGKPMKDSTNRSDEDTKADPKCAKCSDIMDGQIAASCLLNSTKMPAEQKPKAYALALRIRDNKAASVDAREKTMIEDCVGEMSPLVAGQIDYLLEPDKYPK